MTTQQWYSAKELAGLPGMPKTVEATIRRANRENWQRRRRAGRGGGGEYHIKSLPKQTQDALLDAMIANLPEPVCSLPARVETALAPIAEKTLPAPEQLADWQRRTMEARLALLHHIDQLAQATSVNKALDRVVALAKIGQLPPHLQALVPVANARAGKEGTGRLSRRTLLRWRSDLKLGVAALAPREPVKKQAPAFATALLAAWRQPQKPSLSEVVRQLQAAGVAVSYPQARRYLKHVGEIEKNRGRMGPRELKSIKPFRRRDTSNLLPTDVYAADGHTLDAEVAHPDHGRPFRPEITLIVDVATRRIVGWSVALAESTLATLDALRMAVEACGVPAIFYTDNGSGYCNQIMTAPGTGLLARLGIEHRTSIPYNSQARGIIERAHRSILVATAKRLPTYIGAPMDREAAKIVHKRTRQSGELLIEWADFVRLIEAAIDEYHHRPHSGLPKLRDAATGQKRHYSPIEYWQKFEREGWQMVPAGELPDLYRPQVARTVARGEVQLFGHTYFSSALAEFHGDTVFVGYDVHDCSKVWVRDEDQRLICVAELDGNKSDYFPLPVIEQQREKRALGRLKRLERKAEEIELERRGGSLPGTIEVTPERQEARRRIEQEMRQSQTVVEIPQDDRGRYRFWCQLEKRLAAGEVLTEREQRFYEGFARTDIFRAFRQVEQELAIK